MGKDKWKAAELVELLRGRFPMPKFALLTEVPSETGGSGTRKADAIAIGCWPSAGVHLHGFEVKVSRSDWRRELKDLDKSATFQIHCHRWWIVAAPGIVKVEEMPAEWGLLEPRGNGLTEKKAPALREPELVTFEFLAAIMRRALHVQESKSDVSKAFQQGFDAGKESEQKISEIRHERTVSDFKDLAKSVEEFKKSSGIDLDRWNGGKVGSVLKAILSMDGWQMRNHISQMKDAAENLTSIAEKIETGINELNPSTQPVKESSDNE